MSIYSSYNIQLEFWHSKHKREVKHRGTLCNEGAAADVGAPQGDKVGDRRGRRFPAHDAVVRWGRNRSSHSTAPEFHAIF